MILKKEEDITDKVKILFNYDFGREFLSEEVSGEAILSVSVTDDSLAVRELSKLIFQLSDYKAALKNTLKVILTHGKYNLVYELISQVFSSHVGDAKYASRMKAYGIKERFFDRFIEAVKFTGLSEELFMPFVLSTFDDGCNYSFFKDAALEFMQRHFMADSRLIIEKNLERFGSKFLPLVLIINRVYGIKYLLNDCKNPENIHLIKKYKKDILQYLDKTADVNTIAPYLDVLLIFMDDTKVKARLKNIYDKTADEEIRTRISYKLGLAESLSIKTQEQFVWAACRKIKEPVERSLGVVFSRLNVYLQSGQKTDDIIFNFLIYIFKEEKNLVNLYDLGVIKNFFEPAGFDEFIGAMAAALFKLSDIKQAKWCIRMVSLLGNEEQTKANCSELVRLYRAGRRKEASYLLICLIYSKRMEVIGTLKTLKGEYLLPAEELKEITKLLEDNLGIFKEELMDYLAPDSFSFMEEEEEKKRLFSAWLGARKYSYSLFKNVLVKNLAKRELLKKLVFGEYKNGRPHNAFVILDSGEFQYVTNSALDDGEGGYISILHSLDIDSRFREAIVAVPEPLFKQFEESRYNPANFPQTAISIGSFAGTMISLENFLKNLIEFKPNKREDEWEFDSLVSFMTDLGIIALLELKSKSGYINVENLSFYKLEGANIDGGKFTPEHGNVLSVGAVPYRYFNHILGRIRNALMAK